MLEFIADLELHSKFARAVSPQMTLPNLALWAKKKGLAVVVTGDATHPQWFKMIEQELAPTEPGLYRLKDGPETRFIIGGEVSCIYKKGGKVRRVHHLIYAPDLQTMKKINEALSRIGNLRADGRPILGLESKKLLQILLATSPDCVLIPAHVWTPWFGVFGSMSGYDSLTECFEELEPQVFAVETGLSSDPPMNWRVPFLDNKAVISGSDSHSLTRLGREATLFNTDLSYQGIFNALKTRDQRLNGTIEFFPEEGKYHYDGHRLCNTSWSPEETKKHQGLCPKCGRRVTVGVLSRVEQLAAPGRPAGFRPAWAKPFYRFVALDEIIADALDQGKNTKGVWQEYEKAIVAFGSEFNILIKADEAALRGGLKPEVAEGIIRMRRGQVKIVPGYDGEYGKIEIFTAAERETLTQQTSLF